MSKELLHQLFAFCCGSFLFTIAGMIGLMLFGRTDTPERLVLLSERIEYLLNWMWFFLIIGGGITAALMFTN